jgi:hypothetical protein
VKLAISDAHEGIEAAVSKVLSAAWQRRRAHLQENVLALDLAPRRRMNGCEEKCYSLRGGVPEAREWRLASVLGGLLQRHPQDFSLRLVTQQVDGAVGTLDHVPDPEPELKTLLADDLVAAEGQSRQVRGGKPT